jgi:hypothetical protein
MKYDYSTFEYIESTLNPSNLIRLENATLYNPDRHGENHYLDNEGYLITEFTNDSADADGPKFFYKLNRDGFRCKHFEEFDKNKINILYGGCSNTFGYGIPEEVLWTSMLSSKIENSDSYNISVPGASIHMIIKNVMAFIKKCGNPNYIFLMFPDIDRIFDYCVLHKEFVKGPPDPTWIYRDKRCVEFQYVKNFSMETRIMETINLINLLELYCKASGIKLFWSTWSQTEVKLYKHFKFLNFVEFPDKLYYAPDRLKHLYPENIFPENINNLPYWSIARDDGHPGSYWNSCVFELFLNELNKKE